MAFMKILQVIILLFSCSALVNASAGDRDPAFQLCISECTNRGCPSRERILFGLFRDWTCEEECRYSCMWQVESGRRKSGAEPRQYYGKWPFKRVLGVQEPLSTLFSILNAVPHAYELIWRRDRLAPTYLPAGLRHLTMISPVGAINTWVWSTAFHAKDTVFTERMDYHFATLFMVFYLWYAICRLTLSLWPPYTLSVTILAGVILIGVFSYHVWYMNFVSFDYGWNMIFTGTFVILQVVVWISWAVIMLLNAGDSPSKAKKVRLAWMIIQFQVCLVGFAVFEAFDFPPLFDQLDAHAVWHGLTIPLAVYWYSFREKDAMFLSKKHSNLIIDSYSL